MNELTQLEKLSCNAACPSLFDPLFLLRQVLIHKHHNAVLSWTNNLKAQSTNAGLVYITKDMCTCLHIVRASDWVTVSFSASEFKRDVVFIRLHINSKRTHKINQPNGQKFNLRPLKYSDPDWDTNERVERTVLVHTKNIATNIATPPLSYFVSSPGPDITINGNSKSLFSVHNVYMYAKLNWQLTCTRKLFKVIAKEMSLVPFNESHLGDWK